MPFKSEKQRRFLWSQHPDIARRWADEYPGQKNLPTYAHEKKDGGDKPAKEKKEKSAAEILEPVLTKFCTQLVNPGPQRTYVKSEKQSDSKLERLNVPHDAKPTYAGQEPVTAGAEVGCENPVKNVSNSAGDKDKIAADALMNKLAVVLSPVLQQAIAAEQAQQSGQPALYTPQNTGVDLSGPTPNVNIQPPMGMTAPPQPMAAMQPQQPPQVAQQAPAAQPKTAAASVLPPQTAPKGPLPPGKPSRPVTPHPRANPDLEAQRQRMQPVGGGSNPQFSPIEAFGALGNQINGNAAFGQKNSPDSLKTGAAKSTGCSCGCGATVKTCKCGPDCKCRKPGGSCYTAEKTATLGLWDRIRAKRQRGEKPAKPGSKDYPDTKSWKKVTAISEKKAGSPAWQRSAGKNDAGGLNAKGRASYNKATGGHLKAPVTESKPTGERAKRQNSFCSRMCGMKKHETGSKTKNDPDSRINKALRKWNCKCAACERDKTAGKRQRTFGEAAVHAFINMLKNSAQPVQPANPTIKILPGAIQSGAGKLHQDIPK